MGRVYRVVELEVALWAVVGIDEAADPATATERSPDMKIRYVLFAAAFASALSNFEIVSAKTSRPEEADRLELSGDYTIPALIDGQSIRLRVDPDGPAVPAMNPDLAEVIVYKSPRFPDFVVVYAEQVGPERGHLKGRVLKAALNGRTVKRRFFWSTRKLTNLADGTIDPASVPYDIVTFKLRDPKPGEKEVIFSTDGFDFFGLRGVGFQQAIAGQDMEISFNLDRDESLLTARAGKLIAERFGGAYSGEAYPAVIRYGIERPVRPLQLTVPLEIGGIEVPDLAVRISDLGDATTLPETQNFDEDEIVVSAEEKKPKKSDFRLALGRSFLANCSSLTFDIAGKKIILSCV